MPNSQVLQTTVSEGDRDAGTHPPAVTSFAGRGVCLFHFLSSVFLLLEFGTVVPYTHPGLRALYRPQHGRWHPAPHRNGISHLYLRPRRPSSSSASTSPHSTSDKTPPRDTNAAWRTLPKMITNPLPRRSSIARASICWMMRCLRLRSL